jgi:hypothetical protein
VDEVYTKKGVRRRSWRQSVRWETGKRERERKRQREREKEPS